MKNRIKPRERFMDTDKFVKMMENFIAEYETNILKGKIKIGRASCRERV